MTRKRTKKNPADSTTRNVRASKRRDEELKRLIAILSGQIGFIRRQLDAVMEELQEMRKPKRRGKR